MKAVTYQGLFNVKVKEVHDPKIEKGDDLIVRVTASSICGSDLHLYHGMIPSLEKDYVIGHEAVGIVEETGQKVEKFKKGDKVVIPFNIACGQCFFCENDLESQCDVANQEDQAEIGAFYGCSRIYGDYWGSQAELVRVPFANFSPFYIPEECEITDDQLVLLTDALPTAYWGVENSGMKPGDTVIVLGSGPIGLLTQKIAWLKGAERVIAVDHIPYRLQHAKKTNKVEAYNFDEIDELPSLLKEMTKGGADVVIDCVGVSGKMKPIELIETAMHLQGGALGAINTATQAVRKGGTVQLVGVYGLRYNSFPLGDFFTRNVTLKMGMAPVIHKIGYLYQLLQNQTLDVSDLITHYMPLNDGEEAYKIFNKRKDECLKIILKP
ncbi:zinc-dependent alcohol dehydrogenase [Bacillus sp. 31A1R]|uniref:Zinc-dependent alcohol dehydrogenase n=1 Tax=Robertmurraya mangrovi TaxID=3098077 RepID=A0ABU5ITJ3_9BACI|nr:zinc-dependent alcohol dehydrogenase [Bacillus sp. 31A1R]MDZ5470483.1 zinc-dependent alcohol dehydrogenase [Bacillus sp. 31A1R]